MLAEFDGPGTLVRYFDQEFKGRGYNAIMGTGLHSRHTYPGSIDRSVDAIRRQAAEAFVDLFTDVTPGRSRTETVREAGTVRYTSRQDALQFCSREVRVGGVSKFDPDLVAEAKFDAELTDFCRGATVWTVDAPAKVYTTIWRERRGDLAIHFLNGSGCDLKPGEKCTAAAPKLPFPVLRKDITFTIGGFERNARPQCVTVASPDFEGAKELTFTLCADDAIAVILPREAFTSYAVVRIAVR